jgi:hypothetical protein
MIVYTQANGPSIAEAGEKMVKKPNPVYLLEQETQFVVQTNEGPLRGLPGDFVAFDPISGHVWPVKRAYVEWHYEPFHTTEADEVEIEDEVEEEETE